MVRDDAIQDHEFFFVETCEGALIAGERRPGAFLGLLLLQGFIQCLGDHRTQPDLPGLGSAFCGAQGCSREGDGGTNLPGEAHLFIIASDLASICITCSASPCSRAIPLAASPPFGGGDFYNIFVFSNHPQHSALDERHAPGNRWAAFISRKPRVPVHHEKALFDLWKAVNSRLWPLRADGQLLFSNLDR
ncbi:MAG: hypothetical protein SFV54_09770 [Bryobacteraceae bacterium]|nr:hypothetical protein [Bryobacteraceae bacterium]